MYYFADTNLVEPTQTLKHSFMSLPVDFMELFLCPSGVFNDGFL